MTIAVVYKHGQIERRQNMSWKCANCGNTDKNSLFDEGDTFYCSICTHRTVIATGKDDLIICPWCKRLRDRKAAYCDWCNNQINLNPPLTKEEMESKDKSIREFEDGLSSSDIKYWKIKGRRD